jgi:hypothetical protein
MDTKKAIDILIQVALLAQSKGALALGDAVVVKQAIDILQVKQELSPVEATPKVDENTNKEGTK